MSLCSKILLILLSIQTLKVYSQLQFADSLYQQAGKLKDLRNYDAAIANYLKCTQLYAQLDDERGEIKSYNALGLTYQEIQQYDQARKYFNKTLNKLESNPDKKYLAFVLNNLGMLSADQNKLDSAKYYYDRALKLKQTLNDSASIVTTLNNLGVIMLRKNNFNEAINFNQQSLQIKKLIGDTSGVVTAYSNFANIYGTMGKLDSVKYFLDKGYPLARTSKIKSQTLMYYVNYSAYYRANKEFEKAILYKDSVEQMQLTVFSEKLSKNLAKYEAIYETEKKQQALKEEKFRNTLLVEREKKERNKKILYLVLAISIVIISVLIIFTFRGKLKQNKREKKLLQKEIAFKEKELLSSSNMILQKKEIMETLKKNLDKVKDEYGSSEQLIKVLEDSLRQDKTADQEWERFKVHFEQTHDSFFANLKENYPKLTEADLRHCAYIKIGLTTKEISSLLNIAPASVQKSRVRLKKKLNLDKNTDLQEWIKSL